VRAAECRRFTHDTAGAAMQSIEHAPAAAHSRLRHFPISIFSVVMGLAGFAIAVQRAETILGLPAGAGNGLGWAAAGVFVLLTAIYVAKLLRFRDEVANELAHPIKLSFFPAISIGLILLAVALHPASARLSLALLVLGATLQLALTLFVLARWIGQTTFEIQHSNPSWFIPVVGNILVPIAAVDHGLVEIAWFFFSVGLVFWLVLQTIVFNRMIFHHPLPAKLVPTLFILMAPPAVGFVAYVKLAGGLNGFARVLFYTALFTGLLLLALYRKFVGLKFFLSWWAYSFPLAALTIAAMLMYQLTALGLFAALAWALLAVLGAVIALLLARTLKAIARREICVEE
jgi:tellurite resistance protein